ncbi:MAG: hypothetical protein PUD81_02290 [Eggerthellales bacterium]|nr:hypothetical protein [Eggerthellales bacterium]
MSQKTYKDMPYTGESLCYIRTEKRAVVEQSATAFLFGVKEFSANGAKKKG